jgi:hypothetical protein
MRFTILGGGEDRGIGSRVRGGDVLVLMRINSLVLQLISSTKYNCGAVNRTGPDLKGHFPHSPWLVQHFLV